MRAFIVRPFGTKEGIDFDRVEAELIGPALDALDIAGRTTGEIIKQGNIRTDMFALLLKADLVVADVSIHNANVFYELGIRHALRDRRSFLMKSSGESVPFDLSTDRYFYYDADEPAGKLDDLTSALAATINSLSRDSPVFQLLPQLQPADPSVLDIVPFDFQEEVDQAKARGATGVLQLLVEEAKEFDWAIEGFRTVGRAQFDLGDNAGARTTWEHVRDDLPLDIEANSNLATIYDRLGELDKSDAVLRRVLAIPDLPMPQIAQFRALVGRNAKTRWQRDWNLCERLLRADAAEFADDETSGELHGDTAENCEEEMSDAVRMAALRSPHLEQSVDGYNAGFREDRNNCYAGLNALMQVTILTELAEALPEVWAERFEESQDADRRLLELKRLRDDLRLGVKLAAASEVARDRRRDLSWGWGLISRARLIHLVSDNPQRVAHAYREALARAPEWARSSSRLELEGFGKLGILPVKTRAGIDAIDGLISAEAAEKDLDRVVFFVGHRVDSDNRQGSPRFPAASESRARDMIRDALNKERQVAGGRLVGLSGGASGGDILFQEVCEELDIPARLYLALPVMEYAKRSVQDSGPDWVERFYKLCDREDNEAIVLSESNDLPRWLRDKEDYSVLTRSTHWMIHNAFALSPRLTLIALWDGQQGDGPGGTHDIVVDVRRRGAKFVHLDVRELVGQE